MSDPRRTCRAVAEEMLTYVAAGIPIPVAATLCTRHGEPRPGAGVNSPGRPKEVQRDR
jgi:hypothetical protein